MQTPTRPTSLQLRSLAPLLASGGLACLAVLLALAGCDRLEPVSPPGNTQPTPKEETGGKPMPAPAPKAPKTESAKPEPAAPTAPAQPKTPPAPAEPAVSTPPPAVAPPPPAPTPAAPPASAPAPTPAPAAPPASASASAPAPAQQPSAPQASSGGWQVGPDPLKLPEGMPEMGNQHGDVAIASNGDIYVSLMQGLRSGVQVYAADGTYLRNVTNAPTDFHGFVIRQSSDGEFIYGPQLNAGKIVKLTLEGEVVLTIAGESIPKQYWQVNAKTNQSALRLTGCDVAPNGDIFVTDGYASDYVHRFNAKGEYLASFGGKAAPYNFKTLHKIAVDTRFDPPRIVGTDRANNRAVHMSLEGEILGDIATDLLMPAAACIHGDYLAIGEIKGRVSIFDKANKLVARLGENPNPAEVGTNKIEPAQWRPGVVNAPHGVAFNAGGDLFVSEYNVHGRVLKFTRGKPAVAGR